MLDRAELSLLAAAVMGIAALVGILIGAGIERNTARREPPAIVAPTGEPGVRAYAEIFS